MNGVKRMRFSTWVKRFRPVRNDLVAGAPFDGFMFETFGSELETVRSAAKKDPNTVWTLVDLEGDLAVIEGWHFVNRIGYFVCQVRFVDGAAYEIRV